VCVWERERERERVRVKEREAEYVREARAARHGLCPPLLRLV
jgi:hypothetical protein